MPQSFDIGLKALIKQGNRILVLKRHDHPIWEPPGGRINGGETVDEALKRELREELPDISNIRIGPLVHAEMTDFTLPSGNRLMLLLFEVTAHLPATFALSDEHESFAWIDNVSTAGMRIHPPCQAAIAKYLAHT